MEQRKFRLNIIGIGILVLGVLMFSIGKILDINWLIWGGFIGILVESVFIFFVDNTEFLVLYPIDIKRKISNQKHFTY